MITEPHKQPDKYRIIEKTTQAGTKLYFPQFAHILYKKYSRGLFTFWKKTFVREEDGWIYIGLVENESKDVHTKDFFLGKDLTVELKDIMPLSCKSYNDALGVIEKYKVHLAEERKKYRETHFDKKIEDKIHNI